METKVSRVKTRAAINLKKKGWKINEIAYALQLSVNVVSKIVKGK